MGRGGRGGGPGGFGGGRPGGSRGGGGRIGAGGNRPGRGGRNRGGFGPDRGGYNRRRGYRPFFPMFGWGGRRGGRYGQGCGVGGCFAGGCFPLLFAIIGVLFIFNFMWMLVPGSGGDSVVQTTTVNDSTREREPIEEGLVEETPYYTDEVNWINDETTLINGMRHFYNETNIQPHLYITDNLNGNTNPTFEELNQATQDLYEELFNDEAHMLLVFFENPEYEYEVSYHTAYGSQTALVMDQEAEDILFDYLDYYYTSDMTDAEYFGTVFQETADRIMEVTRSPWIPVLIIVGLVALVWLLYRWWRNSISENRKRNENKRKEAEDADEIDF